ncbi:hypothetical protein BO82DRAFT_304496 [Aspergillus uvarum CBS 121591]|uniref:Uncharacterized protein n=1 Tax=Aspergillus uvarum CBS 121591 TaxID=1448315 RepID=A0A319CMV2_9EURO|nr:hypothetical protein BO82DRAFT_304496 [Aspergillus uvarum CBS 121591]PYH84397.1 hypothetical protein BO82DRAFT_304496 [Aspergillus uvarum CBS 121591]
MSAAPSPHPSKIPVSVDRKVPKKAQDEYWKSAPERATYVSFGDQGLTATIGAYGSLLRICCPILSSGEPSPDNVNLDGRNSNDSDPENENPDKQNSGDHSLDGVFRSKIMCLESSGQEAYYVWGRAYILADSADDPNCGFGLRLDNNIQPELSTVDFVDNRWPIIKYKTKQGFSITVQAWCQDGMVLQQMLIDRGTDGPDAVKLSLNMSFAMQDLNYMHRRDNIDIREDRPADLQAENYILLKGQHKRNSRQSQIGVLVGLFKDNQSHPLRTSENSEPRTDHAESLTPDRDADSVSQNAQEGDPRSIALKHKFVDQKDYVTYTAVFMLQVASSGEWSSLEISTLPREPTPHSDDQSDAFGSYEERVNWHCHRNLEHILSVCSIPLDETPLKTNHTPTTNAMKNTSTKRELESSAPAPRNRGVALTCGDFGDHRVSISGGYFAFMFMLEMYRRPEKRPSASDMCGRIKRTCKGHLEWVFNLDPDASSSANVWIDGQIINLSGSYTSVPNDNPSILPCHIIKATEYIMVFQDSADFEFVCKGLGSLCKEWFLRLNRTKNRRTPTWQHSQSSDVPFYRLGDHLWIWKALKGLEEVLDLVEFQRDKLAADIDSAVCDDFLKLRQHMHDLMAEKRERRQPMTAEKRESHIYFNSEDVRKENIKRFTVRNEVFNKRMLSVTRSANETRFLLHSRDTVLYYGGLWGFFGGQEDLIHEMLNIQAGHDDSLCDEVEWSNPLRYGLALLWSSWNYQLTGGNAPDQMVKRAKRVLLGSSCATGLFPGNLNEEKKGTIFNDEAHRDFYFHAGFEVPYILLKSLDPNGVEFLPRKKKEDYAALNSATVTTHQQVYRESRIPNDQSFQSRTGTQLVSVPLTLRKQNPYGTSLDVNIIVDVPDEWLFKDPDFLDFIPPDSLEDRIDIVKDAADVLGLVDGGKSVCEGMERLKTNDWKDPAGVRQIRSQYAAESLAIVLDIRKSNGNKQIDDKYSVLRVADGHFDSFTSHLLSKRLLDASKKRVVYIRIPTCEMNAICYLATPEHDRPSFASFVQRHCDIKTSFFHDDVVVETNSWVTEFHCRFFRAVDKKYWERSHAHRQTERGGGAAPARRYSRRLASKLCPPLGKGLVLVDDVFSLSMVGDWCDRHWTCHVLETSTASNDLFKRDWFRDNLEFTQRKVLELTLVNKLLIDFHQSTREILRRVEQDSHSSALGMSEELYSTMSFKNRKQELLDETFQVLCRVKDSITGVRTLIDDWKQRESSQGRERPRWTRSDEQKHGQVLRKQTNELAKHDREVNALLSHVDFLISLVNNEKTLSQARDVTRFTYATVFFLPVGLAVSVFSMSGPPDHTAILGMVITAIVALVVTVAFLWLVIRVPTQVYPRSQSIGSLMKDFLTRKANELAHVLGLQGISKPTNASRDSVDEADTDEDSISVSRYWSISRYMSDKIAALLTLRHRHASNENEADKQA